MDDIQLIFLFQGSSIIIQCKRYDRMYDIFQKFTSKVNIDMKDIYFLYKGDVIRKELKVEDIVDKEDYKVNFLVEEYDDDIKDDILLKQSKDVICPQCKEICIINFKDYYQINLDNCINGHCYTNILLEEFYDLQKINESEILCKNCNNNKMEAFNNKFFKCCNCNINLCPLCKQSHNKNDKIIDYELKDYYCNNHGEKFIIYCEECRKNLCNLCQIKNHKNVYLNEIPKFKDYNMNKLRIKIDKLKNEINDS